MHIELCNTLEEIYKKGKYICLLNLSLLVNSDTERLKNDSIDLIRKLDPHENLAESRIYLKIIYELYQRTLLSALSKTYHSAHDVIQGKDLKKRYGDLTILMDIAKIDKFPLEKWRDTINELYNERNKIEHNDLYIPSLNRFTPLNKALTELNDFERYLAGFCIDYDRKFSTLDLNSKIELVKKALFTDLAVKLERTSQESGNGQVGTKKTFTSDYILRELESIDGLIKILAWPIFENYSTLSELLTLVGALYYLDGRESAYISMEVCPRCAGKIETATKYGGNSEDGPIYVNARVGCSECDYTLNDETFSI
jgi:hypothetical protein